MSLRLSAYSGPPPKGVARHTPRLRSTLCQKQHNPKRLIWWHHQKLLLPDWLCCPPKTARQQVMPDDHSVSVPPLPIPNRTVKRLHADDSADYPCESR